jgi:hypothetical protein
MDVARQRKEKTKTKTQKEKVMKLTTHVFGTCLAVASLVLLGAENLGMAAGRNPNPGIVKSPSSGYRGSSYGERAAQWWQTMYSIPVVNGEHPLLNGGAVMGEDSILFLAAAPATATINVTVPRGTAIFVPVVNAECSTVEPDPFHGETEAELRACANGHIDNTSGLTATVDGAPVVELATYREESPFFEFTLPENNVLQFLGQDVPPGTTAQAVDAGVYLLLNPLKEGGHTIQVMGTFDELGATIDTTFHITVE